MISEVRTLFKNRRKKMARDGHRCYVCNLCLLSSRSLHDNGLEDRQAIDRPVPLLLLLSLFPPLRRQRELLGDCLPHRASRRHGVAAPRGRRRRRRRRGHGAVQGAVERRLAEGHHGHEPPLHRRRHWGIGDRGFDFRRALLGFARASRDRVNRGRALYDLLGARGLPTTRSRLGSRQRPKAQKGTRDAGSWNWSRTPRATRVWIGRKTLVSREGGIVVAESCRGAREGEAKRV